MATTKKTTTKRKRRKKRHYITGTHKSPKCNELINYRSSWEYIVCLHLDNDPNVISYEYEKMRIPYVSNRKYMKIRHYTPDFVVLYSDGRKVIIEVKPKSRLNNLKVVKKAEATRYWAKANNIEYVFWTEDIIKEIKKLLG